MGVVFRVCLHRRRERTARPVRFLRTLGKRHVEIFLDQGGEAEFLQAEHSRRDDGVEDFAGRQVVGAAEQAQFKIHSLEDDFPARPARCKGLQIDPRQRINRGDPGCRRSTG